MNDIANSYKKCIKNLILKYNQNLEIYSDSILIDKENHLLFIITVVGDWLEVDCRSASTSKEIQFAKTTVNLAHPNRTSCEEDDFFDFMTLKNIENLYKEN